MSAREQGLARVKVAPDGKSTWPILGIWAFSSCNNYNGKSALPPPPNYMVHCVYDAERNASLSGAGDQWHYFLTYLGTHLNLSVVILR